MLILSLSSSSSSCPLLVRVLFISLCFEKVVDNSTYFTIDLLHRARISKTDHGLSFYEGMLPMLSFGVMVALFYIWALFSPVQILELQPRLFFTANGIVFSNVAVRVSLGTCPHSVYALQFQVWC